LALNEVEKARLNVGVIRLDITGNRNQTLGGLLCGYLFQNYRENMGFIKVDSMDVKP
jgi:hypothetical protein